MSYWLKIPFSCLSFELEKQRRPDKHRFKKCTSSPAARGVASSLRSIFMYSRAVSVAWRDPGLKGFYFAKIHRLPVRPVVTSEAPSPQLFGNAVNVFYFPPKHFEYLFEVHGVFQGK